MAFWFYVACQIAVIACAIVGSAFLTFADFDMRALDKSSNTAGVEVMQVINREVFRSSARHAHD